MAGFEPTTFRSGGGRSIQLSYTRVALDKSEYVPVYSANGKPDVTTSARHDATDHAVRARSSARRIPCCMLAMTTEYIR